MNLKEKTFNGLFWSFLSQGGKQLSQFIITVILARLLNPNDFGLMAMATVFTNFVTIFSEMGISSALIQKQDTHDRHFYSAFWLNIIVGILLTLVFIVVSPLIAWFYKRPELKPILIVVSVNFLISSFVIIQQTILTKEMDFKKLAIRDLIAVVIAGIVGVYLAYSGHGVWSLVYQLITFTLINAILLWTLSQWRPKFSLAISDIKDIFNFSANVTGFNFINYFARNVDQLLIGRFLGAESLGYYSVAYKLMLYPLQNISRVIGGVMFPAFSKIQNDLEKVRNVYCKTIKTISLITFPMLAGLIALAPEFIRLFYGPSWSPMIILVQILCFCGLFQSIGTTTGLIFMSQGKADVQLKLQLTGTAIVITSVILGLLWGVNGVAIFYTIQSVIWVHYTFFVVNKLIYLKYGAFYKMILPAFVMSIIMIISILLIKIFFFASTFQGLIVSIFVGATIYGLLFLIMKDKSLVMSI
ncbi:MAG: MOP flippase family protein [Candidatus Omnitrophica bacterium]|nr:MOP flippase family protein [Candidatus Omnitrophota bacterium]